MNYISFEEFKRLNEYQQFILDNPDVGYLKVQAFTAYGAIPIENVKVIVYKDIGNYRVIFFEGNTDSSGIISDIMLPAPETITDPNATPAYTIYNMIAIHSEYEAIKNYSIGMFGDVRVLQYVKMMPQISLEGGQLDND